MCAAPDLNKLFCRPVELAWEARNTVGPATHNRLVGAGLGTREFTLLRRDVAYVRNSRYGKL